MRAGWIGILFSPDGGDCDVEAGIEQLRVTLRSTGYLSWEAPVDRSAIVEPWELRSYLVTGHGPYLMVHPQHGPDPDQTALRISERYPDQAVVLYMPELYDQVPGLGRVARGGPEGAEVTKIYLNKRPELKVGNAVDNEVAYPVPQVSRERAPVVLQALRTALGVYHKALEQVLTGAAIDAGIEVVDVISAISFPAQRPIGGAPLNFVHRDAPLAINTP